MDLTRARAEIMRTSSSDFMMRLIRASGRSLCVLKLCSDVISSCSMSMLCSFQNFLRNACICRTCLRRGGRALTSPAAAVAETPAPRWSLSSGTSAPGGTPGGMPPGGPPNWAIGEKAPKVARDGDGRDDGEQPEA